MSREELIALIMQLFKFVGCMPQRTASKSRPPPRRIHRNHLPAIKSATGPRGGAKPGHAKAERLLSDHPDALIEARVTQYADCGADLRAVASQAMVRRRVVELPAIADPRN